MRMTPGAPIMTLVLTAVVLLPAFSGAAVGQTDGAVRVGEPLHIYFRKDVPQQMLYLHFYPPSGKVPLSDTSGRFTIDRKGGPNSSAVAYFPRDPTSNFLQFEPNASVAAEYRLMLFATTPKNASDGKAKLLLTIELDHQRDGRYDRKVSTTVSFDANSSFVEVSGRLPMDAYEMRKFDGKSGGRVKMTLSRVDELDTIVVIHCGSSEHPSYVQLPFSKYSFLPGDDRKEGISPFIIIGIGSAVVVAFIIALKVLERRRHRGPPEGNGPAKRRGGKRWSKKGKGR